MTGEGGRTGGINYIPNEACFSDEKMNKGFSREESVNRFKTSNMS